LASHLDEVGGQLVGFAAGGAVANGNQVHAMLFGQLGQRVQRAFPVAAWLVRVHGGGLHQFARGIHHGHLHAGADAGVQPHHHARAGGRCQQQVAQVVGKHLDRHFFGIVAQAGKQVAFGREAEFDAPGPGHALADQVVGLAALVAPAQVQGNLALGDAGLARVGLGRGIRLRLRQHQLGFQNLQTSAPEHRQRAVRGHAADGLVVFKVVAKLGDLGVVLVLAVHLLAAQQALGPQPLAQGLHQHRVLGPALGEDVAHAIEHRGHGRKIGACLAVVLAPQAAW
jgi:hypothetical protein